MGRWGTVSTADMVWLMEEKASVPSKWQTDVDEARAMSYDRLFPVLLAHLLFASRTRTSHW